MPRQVQASMGVALQTPNAKSTPGLPRVLEFRGLGFRVPRVLRVLEFRV